MNKAAVQYVQLVYFYRLLLIRQLALFNLLSLLAENLSEEISPLEENENAGDSHLRPIVCAEKGRWRRKDTAQEEYPETSLMYYGARYYDPGIGRFITADSVVATGPTKSSMNSKSANYFKMTYRSANSNMSFNRYMYVNGNPVIYKDPTGHCFELFLYFTDAGYELQQTFSPIAVKISIEIGSEQIGIGIDVSIGVPTLFPVAYRESWGETSYINNYGEFQGTEQRHGEEWTVGYFVSYGYTTFSSGDTSQTTYTLTVGTPWINIKYENDMNLHEAAGINLPSFSDAAGDSYRTGAFQANFFGFSGGINIFTGSKSNLYPNGTYLDDGQNDPDKYRAGVLYIGFGPIRLGVNSEVVRGGVQNGIHDLTGDPHFAVLDIKPTFYFYFGTGSGGTLW